MTIKKSKNHDKVVKKAYSFLVMYRSMIEEKDPELAEEVREAYEQLWCECINERPPWLGAKH